VSRETNGSSGKANRAALVGQFEELTVAGIAPWKVAPTMALTPEGEKRRRKHRYQGRKMSVEAWAAVITLGFFDFVNSYRVGKVHLFG